MPKKNNEGKIYIVDSSVLKSDEDCLQSLGAENTKIVPEASLYDLEKDIARGGLEGEVAKRIAFYINSLRTRGSLKDGVLQDDGSKLIVEINHKDAKIPESWATNRVDERVLQVCLGVKSENPDKEVILLSKNPILQTRAHLVGINAQNYHNGIMPELKNQYRGRCDLLAKTNDIQRFLKDGYLSFDKVRFQEETIERETLYVNEYCVISDGLGWSESGRFDGEKIVPLHNVPTHGYLCDNFNIMAKNIGQKFAWESLVESYETAPLALIKGPAGTAKTFLALAAGITAVEKGEYEAVLVSRCMIETSDGMGYLPGDKDLKMDPYLGCFRDNLSDLIYNSKISKDEKITRKEREDTVQEYFDRGIVYAEPINFLRGRSIRNTYIIIDEAQNLTRPLANLIVTRAGIGTKIVFLGDCQQVDRPMYNERDNGLSYMAEKFKGQDWCWQLATSNEESVRSRLAKESSNMI